MSLEAHIQDIQDKLNNGEYPNEQTISQAVVLRLLREMGWNTDHPQIVTPEYSIPGGRVDFALCVQKDRPIVFIEVKQPGNTFGADEQLFKYAYHRGVPFAIVTDGKGWHFYLPAQPGSYDERRVCTLDLVEREVRESTERLQRYLSFHAVSSGQAFEHAQEDYKNVSRERQAKANIPKAWGQLITEEDEILVDLVSERVEYLCGYKPKQQQVISYLRSLQAEPGSSPTLDPQDNAGISHGTNHPHPSHPGPRAPRKKIKVTFPDGGEICHNTVVRTLVETIKKIGADKVYPLHCIKMRKGEFDRSKYVGHGIYVTGLSSTSDKYKQLQQINKALVLGLKIELR